jgi:hypothetical protein
MESESTKKERVQNQLLTIIRLVGVADFMLDCIKQDNLDPNNELHDYLYSGILDDISDELTAIDGLLTYVLVNPKPVTGYSPEENECA